MSKRYIYMLQMPITTMTAGWLVVTIKDIASAWEKL